MSASSANSRRSCDAIGSGLNRAVRRCDNGPLGRPICNTSITQVLQRPPEPEVPERPQTSQSTRLSVGGEGGGLLGQERLDRVAVVGGRAAARLQLRLLRQRRRQV